MATLKVRQFVPDPWEYQCGQFTTFEAIPNPLIGSAPTKVEISIGGVLFVVFPTFLPLLYDVPGPTGGKWWIRNKLPRDYYGIMVMNRDGLLQAQASLGTYPVMQVYPPVPQGVAIVVIGDQTWTLNEVSRASDMSQEIVKWQS